MLSVRALSAGRLPPRLTDWQLWRTLLIAAMGEPLDAN